MHGTDDEYKLCVRRGGGWKGIGVRKINRESGKKERIVGVR